MYAVYNLWICWIIALVFQDRSRRRQWPKYIWPYMHIYNDKKELRCYLTELSAYFHQVAHDWRFSNCHIFVIFSLNAVFSHAHKNLPLWPLKCRLWQVRSRRGSARGLYTTLSKFLEMQAFLASSCGRMSKYFFLRSYEFLAFVSYDNYEVRNNLMLMSILYR